MDFTGTTTQTTATFTTFHFVAINSACKSPNATIASDATNLSVASDAFFAFNASPVANWLFMDGVSSASMSRTVARNWSCLAVNLISLGFKTVPLRLVEPVV